LTFIPVHLSGCSSDPIIDYYKFIYSRINNDFLESENIPRKIERHRKVNGEKKLFYFKYRINFIYMQAKSKKQNHS